MKHSKSNKLLSVVMAILMVVTMFPVTAFAAGSATWTKVDFADITSSDTIMITMTNPSGVTYALPNAKVTAKPGPAAEVVTVEGSTITTASSSGYGWTITAVDGGYTISSEGNYLNTVNDNNGIRVNDTQGVWNLDGNYLKTTDGSNDRWLGVYDNNNGDYSAVANPNWRAYKNTTGNTKNQTVGFWKLEGSSGSETPEEPEGVSYELVEAPKAGDTVVMYNAATGTLVSSTKSGYKLAAVEAFVDGDTIVTSAEDVAWTVGGEGTEWTFAQGDKVLGMVQSGTYVNLSTDPADGNTAWTLENSETANVFFLKNTNMPAGSYGPYYLEYYSGWTAYASSKPSDSAFGISFYKLIEEEEEPAGPVIVDIAKALAATEGEFTVKGVVTLVDGSNLYLQDATGAICARMSSKPTDVALGDTVIATGSRADYNGLPQLGSGTYEKSEGLSLEAREVTIDALTTADICTYIELKGVEITEIYDNNGQYSAPNITVTDGVNSIQIYKAVISKAEGAWEYAVGDVIDVKAAVGVYKTTLQLRNTLAEEISIAKTEEPQYAEKMTSLPKNGDTVIIYNSGNAMGSEASGKRLSAIEAAVSENKLALAEGMAQLLVTVEDGHYIFTLDGKYLTSAETGNGLSFEDELTDCGRWTVEEAVEGAWYIKNVGANYNGNYNQAMEYYKGFTTYGIKETEIYQMQFFLVSSGDAVPDGDYVIWAPAYNMSLSSEYTGYYNKGVEVTEKDGKLSGYGATEVWTVTNNDDGTLSLSYGGKNLAMADSYSSLTLGEKNDKWVLEDAGNGLYYVKNAVRGAYIEWYAAKGNWSGYAYINSGSEGLFALKFTPAEEIEESNLPSEGDEVVIYNLSAQGVLGAQNDTNSINNVMAVIWDYDDGSSKADPENGAAVFTVSKNGDYYRFYNEAYGYLCSNGTGNNAFYTQEASDDADWILTEGKSGGFNLESRTAKYNGQYSQYLEYYADCYKTYSMYNVTDYDIYEFFFYTIEESVETYKGIVHMPDVNYLSGDEAAYVGQDWVVEFELDSAFPVTVEPAATVCVLDGNEYVSLAEAVVTGPVNGVYTATVSAEDVAKFGEQIILHITAAFEGDKEVSAYLFADVIDEPSVGEISPAANSQTGENKRPVISAEIINAGEDAVVSMTVNGEEVKAVYDGKKVTYTPSEDLDEGRTVVGVKVVRADGKEAEKNWSFIVGEAQYELYFGQLHSHTTYSDGSGSLEAALEYIYNLPESANVDFVAFTDHSNYFDGSSAGTTANPEGALYDMSLASEISQGIWNEYKNTIADFNASQGKVVAIGGFEMTWSGGPGHINTFNTEGIVSRNNTTLNNKTNDAGMKAYYALLSQAEGADSISQFNHPGSTFGTFSDFAYWDAVIDDRIYLVEVGNGEGQVGAGGYYPSYEYYTMALDKGWHVSPTNNQDNHKGKWGNANDARDVILTDNFTEEGIYEAIRAMRMYSTEDKNLEISYTVNGLMLGSIIEEVPEKLNFEVTVYDPDSSDSISKVEIIVNSGKVAYTWDDPAELASGVFSVELDPDYSYYYIRVTEGDGDLAVTSPVWVGESLKLGISSVTTTTTTPVTGEELTITTTLFNSESTEATVKSLTYTTNGSQTIGLDVNGYTLPASGTFAVDFAFVPENAKLTTVTVTAVVVLEGVEYVFTMDIELDVQDADKLVYVGIDASHYNEYVNGNYKDNMGNFSQLAAEYGVRTVTLYASEDLVEACSNPKYKALILTAPSRRSSEAQSSNPLKVYTEEELAAIKAFNENGGIVILAGWSDHYENYPEVASIANMKAEEHMAATQNAVLEALGSSLRIGDDATYDDEHNGGQAYRLYFNTYGESFLTEGVEVDPENRFDRLYTEVFSHYGGASIYTVDGTLPSTVAPVVFGHSGTYSVDVDKDGLGGDSMYKYTSPDGDERLLVMASEQLEGQGLIIVSGAAFMSNFEVQATIEDSGSEKNYSNYKICENLLAYINPVTVTDIAEVRAQKEAGYKYTIEGVVTSNASGYDKDTAFFDCIYVQDATGGICCFPVAGNFKIGDKVRVTGTTEFYQGEPELQVTSIELIGEGEVTAKEVTAKEINDRSAEGQLVTVKGKVISFEYANGLIQTIIVKDANGDVARVFIDGYITIGEDVKNIKKGCDITVTGLASYDDTFNAPEGPFPRIRVRDRADVVCTAASGGSTEEKPHVHEWGDWNHKDAYSERYCPVCGVAEIVFTGRTDGEDNPETGAPVKAGSAVSAIAVLAAAAIVLGKRK